MSNVHFDSRPDHSDGSRKQADYFRWLYESGMSVEEVARRSGAKIPLVRNMIVDAGGELRRCGRPVGSVIPAEDIARALKLYQCGMSLRQTAAEFGVSHEVVRRWLAEAGVERRRRGSYPRHGGPAVDISQAVDLYRGGMSLKQVAAELGVGNDVVRTRLTRAGVKCRGRGAYPGQGFLEVDVSRAADLYKSGMSLRQVAAELGVGHELVRRRLASAGVGTKRTGG